MRNSTKSVHIKDINCDTSQKGFMCWTLLLNIRPYNSPLPLCTSDLPLCQVGSYETTCRPLPEAQRPVESVVGSPHFKR